MTLDLLTTNSPRYGTLRWSFEYLSRVGRAGAICSGHSWTNNFLNDLMPTEMLVGLDQTRGK